MSYATTGSKADPNGRIWDEDLIFHVLNHRLRRHLLLNLARNGARPASKLSGLKLQSTIKHLVEMIEAGMVIKSPNPEDGRQPLYALSPAVCVVKTETGAVIDFGVGTVRL